MVDFKIINNINEIKLNNNWVLSKEDKATFVDAKGKIVSSTYEGHCYRLISKEQIFSTWKYAVRCFLGVAAIVCSLGLALLIFDSAWNLFKRRETVYFGILVLSANAADPKARLTSPNTPISLKKTTDQKTPLVTPPALDNSQKKQTSIQTTTDNASHTISLQKPDEEDNISKRELQQGISISEETISKIQTCMESILHRTEEKGVKLHKGQWSHRIFELETVPGLIFKMKDSTTNPDYEDSMNARYQKMIKGQTVVRTHQLGLLVIPHATLFSVHADGKEYDIIAEQKVDINPEESAQEQYFQDYAENLNETIRQLAIFICKTGYSDVEWRNNPVLNNSLDVNGNRKIALIDLEEMNSPTSGLFGGAWGRRGLVRCVNKEQGKIVETVAKEQSINTSDFASEHAQRKIELKEERKLKKYYATKNIIKGDEPVQIDEKKLDFSAFPEESEKLIKLTLSLIEKINEIISNHSPNKSIKGRRHIYIDTNRGPFMGLDNRSINKNNDSVFSNEEYYNGTFLGCVVKKLEELGAIYKLIDRNGHGYFLQA